MQSMRNMAVSAIISAFNTKFPSKLMMLNERSSIPRIAYLSHDGDEIERKELMKVMTLRRGFTPLHPEAAMDMYIASTHYANKRDVIKDSLSLMLMCDACWVLSPTQVNEMDKFIEVLSEGAISEAFRWMIDKETPAQVLNMNKSEDYKGLTDDTEPFDNLFAGNSKIFEILDTPHFRLNGIKPFLNMPVAELRKTAYVLVDGCHYKYKGWLRRDIYSMNLVPVFPLDQVDCSTLTLAGITDKKAQIARRVSFALKADLVYIYGPKEIFDPNDFSEDFLNVLYNIMMLAPNSEFQYKSFEQAGIQKFKKDAAWALTDREHEQNQSVAKHSSILFSSANVHTQTASEKKQGDLEFGLQ